MAINTSDSRQSALAASIKLNLYFHSDSRICFSFLSAIVEAVPTGAGVGVGAGTVAGAGALPVYL